MFRMISKGTISGTGYMEIPSKIFGGVVLSTDTTNANVTTIRKYNPVGDVIGDYLFDVSSKIPFQCLKETGVVPTGWIYYSISGTGASTSIYEYVK